MPSTAITGQTTFGANTSGTTTQLDNNFLLAYNALNSLNTFGNYFADGGAANAYTVTLPAGLTAALSAGLPVQFKAANANTGASTLNVNATGVKNILNADGSALGSGQIPANSIVSVMYDGTQYLMLSQFSRGYNLLQTVTAANQATVDLTGITSAYTEYMVTMTDVVPVTSGDSLLLRISQATVFKSGAADYAYGFLGYGVAAAYFQGSSAGTTSIAVCGGVSNAGTSATYAGELKIFNPGGTTRVKTIMWQEGWTDNLGNRNTESGSGVYVGTTSGTPTAAIDGVRFICSTGNILSGVFALYGLAK